MPMRNDALKIFWDVCPPVNSKGIVVFSKCHKFQDNVKYIFTYAPRNFMGIPAPIF